MTTGETSTGENAVASKEIAIEELIASLGRVTTHYQAARAHEESLYASFELAKAASYRAGDAMAQAKIRVAQAIHEQYKSGALAGDALIEAIGQVAKTCDQNSRTFKQFHRDKSFYDSLQPGEIIMIGDGSGALSGIWRLMASPEETPNVLPRLESDSHFSTLNLSFRAWVKKDNDETLLQTTVRSGTTVVGPEAIEKRLNEQANTFHPRRENSFYAARQLANSYRSIGQADKAAPFAEEAKTLAVKIIQDHTSGGVSVINSIGYLKKEAPELLEQICDQLAISMESDDVSWISPRLISFIENYLNATIPNFENLPTLQQNEKFIAFLAEMNRRGIELSEQQTTPEAEA